MKFFWSRSKPKFKPGHLVEILSTKSVHAEREYLQIEQQRWLLLNGETKKQWVYDGSILTIKEGVKLICPSDRLFLLERDLWGIPGLEYFGVGYH